MKKLFTIFFVAFCFIAAVTAQSNITIDLDDDVYDLLRTCELQNLCSTLSYARPYSKSYVLNKLEEIKTNLDEDSNEIKIIQTYIDKYDIKPGLDIKNATLKVESKSDVFPVTFVVNDSLNVNFGTGLYADSDQNSHGYEIYNALNFMGDLGKNVSYSTSAFLGLCSMPLEYLGEYNIGQWLYDDFNKQQYVPRIVYAYRNNSFLPYKYDKYWDGSAYYLSNISASGLESWPFDKAICFSMIGDIHGSFYDNKVELGFGRKQREWAAMDTGSSLVLNSAARPFIALEADFHPFEWLSFSTLTGVLEAPNQSHINRDAWYEFEYDSEGNLIKVEEDEDGEIIRNKAEDSFFFQNAFSMAMVGLDLRYFHFDFGSTCVWPKRFELGYAFPLIDRVVYQNNVGDYDNLALFVNFKGIYPGVGQIWLSGYLDEVNVILKSRFWEKARAMFAVQAGTKVFVPFLPFTTASFRYTKVEPYCYTHHGINYTPWSSHYISESYTNNGESLGYYLAPNSDEFNFEVKTNALEYATLGFQYQLIRHGVDWGTGAVGGSNLYSELRNYDRDDLYKYFLHDGTYEWSNIVSLYGDYDFRRFNLPIKMFMNIGFIYDWFTEINGEPGWGTSYSRVNNNEYSDKVGVVINIGCSIFQR